MPEQIEASVTVKTTTLTYSSIVVNGTGLELEGLDKSFFDELDVGVPAAYSSIANRVTIDYGKFGFFVDLDEQKILAGDTSGSILPSSPIPRMVHKFVASQEKLKVKSVGFNFAYEVEFEEVDATAFLQKFLNLSAFGDDSNNMYAAGAKVAMHRDEDWVMVELEPTWKESEPKRLKASLAYINEPQVDFQTRFTTLVAESLLLVQKLVGSHG